MGRTKVLTDEQRRQNRSRNSNDWIKRTGYTKTNFYRFIMLFHKTHDADMIDWLNQQENRAGYIKSLIRADMDARKVDHQNG